MYEVFEQLLQKKGVSSYKVAKEAGVTQTALSNWKSGRSTPTAKTLQKIADYFGVTIDYLMTGDDSSEQGLTARDNRDIAKDLDNIMEKLTSGENGPASYNGEEISPEAAELFKDELEIALKRLKLINKEKYTPKKYKKNHRYIFINENLPEYEQRLVMAHELGHAILHRKENCYFIRNRTLLLNSKKEIEANRFAMELLLPDSLLEEYRDFTIEQISRITGYHQNLIELRLKK